MICCTVPLAHSSNLWTIPLETRDFDEGEIQLQGLVVDVSAADGVPSTEETASLRYCIESFANKNAAQRMLKLRVCYFGVHLQG